MRVYKIRLTGLGVDQYWGTKVQWVQGVNILPKVGGSGKTWTSKKLVEKTFNEILNHNSTGYSVEIVEFDLIERK